MTHRRAGAGPLLTEGAFQALRRWVYERSGLVLDETKRELAESRVRSRLARYPGLSPEEYLERLRADPGEAAELLDQFTVNETYFFRDAPQIAAFQLVLEELMAEKRWSQQVYLRVWSAGCSIGCEPYTLAMCVQEAVEGCQSPVDWHILATDISPSALRMAASALYSDREVREVPPALLGKYFRKNGEWWEFAHPCRGRVRFRQCNLLRPEKAVQRPFDVIFCRNLLIYFDDAARRQAAGILYDALAPGGYLFLGAAESMGRVSRAFQLRRVGQGFVYTRA